NAPGRDPALLEAIAAAVERGVVVVNTTQCLRGGVDMDGYATGSALRRVGVVSGADMTPEAALAKLIWLLGQGLEPALVRELAAGDLRGELTAGGATTTTGRARRARPPAPRRRAAHAPSGRAAAWAGPWLCCGRPSSSGSRAR